MSKDFSLRFTGYTLPEGEASFAVRERSFETNRHTTTFTGFREKLLPVVKGINPGDFLLFYDQFSDVSAEHLKVSFQELSDTEDENQLSQTRRRNSHGLLFGQLVLTSQKDKEKGALTVIKPFATASDALHEYAATSYVNAFTKHNRPVQGLVPTGIHRFEDGSFGLLTKYEHEVISYDNTFWDPEIEPTPEQIEKAMGKIALALAKMHLMGITHGDAQVKNFATDNHGIRLIDLESASGFPIVQNEFNPDLVASRISEDIDTLVNSFNTGIENKLDYRDYDEALERWFIPRYVGAVSLPESKIPKKAQLKPRQIVKLIEQS